MELKHYLSTILKWWWLIALSTAVAAAFSYYASAQSPRIYQTATTLMVGQALQSPNPDNIQVYAATQLAQTYVQIVRRQPDDSSGVRLGEAGCRADSKLRGTARTKSASARR